MAFSPAPTDLSETVRTRALARFQRLRPFLEDGVPLTRVARAEGIALRTARRWVARYRAEGLAGLGRRPRSDRGGKRFSTSLCQIVEGLVLHKPRLSIAAVHRRVVHLAQERGEAPPSYSTVYALVRQIGPALLTLAHEGKKAYSETFDLLYRHEAEAPNAVWQADHTELDVWLRDERGQARKPWLTVVLDDFSRAIAGYTLSFSAPSALQTALALRQAIWRKAQGGWHVCGIPARFYTDHGSDFTSRHIEQAAADLKMQMIFSGVGKPRGRGKIERFFETLTQVLLSRLPGYAPLGAGSVRTGADRPAPVLTLPTLDREIEAFLLDEYHLAPHSATGVAPQARWEAGGFLPQMPENLERLDLLLLTVAKGRRVHQDGLRFQGLRYLDLTLAAYVGEEVTIRYDPRDMAEIRVFHKNRFLCRAVCPELAGETVGLKEVVRARNERRRKLQGVVKERRALVAALVHPLGTPQPPPNPEAQPPADAPSPSSSPLRRYAND